MKIKLISFTWIFVLFSTMQIEGVTVNPYPCPTNKIAPHRRILTRNSGNPRTFGAYYDLLAPNFNQQYAPSNALLEEPQKDDPEDCGDIEDYDENDLSSLTSLSQQRRGRGPNDNRFFFGILRPQQPAYPPQPVPAQPTRPPNYPPHRPPYWSGGHFGDNHYRPPAHHNPSDTIKPVYEAGAYEPPVMYRPEMVGGPIQHVVGVSPASVRPQPTRNPTVTKPQRSPRPSYDRYTTRPTQSSNSNYYTTRRPRSRRPKDDSIIGSFIDLLF